MPHLEIKLCDGRTIRLDAPTNRDVDGELQDFLERRGGYRDEWVRIADGEYVRYDQIVNVKRIR